MSANAADDNILCKSGLKILNIGNSYTIDCVYYLDSITQALGVDMSDICIYRTYCACGSYKDWYNIYNDQYENEYTFKKVVGDLKAKVKPARGKAYEGDLFRKVLKEEEWDLILIQQASYYAPYYNRWREQNDYGYLDQFMSILKENQPNAQIGFVLIHSFWDNFGNNVQHSSFERWRKIAYSAHLMQTNEGMEIIIPYGTAMESLRMTSINNEWDLTRDGMHVTQGIGKYLASCGYYEALLAPRFGLSISECSFMPIVPSTSSSKYPPVQVNDYNAEIARKAVLQSIITPYLCINPEDGNDKFGSLHAEIEDTDENGFLLTFEINDNTSLTDGIQFDLSLPDGFSLLELSDNNYQITVSDRFTGPIEVNVNKMPVNTYRISCRSTEGKTLKGSDGRILSLGLKKDDDVTQDHCTATLRNIVISQSDDTGAPCSDIDVEFQINDNLLTGDVNNDSYIDVADVMHIVNHIMENAQPNFSPQAADINHDGIIDVADVMCLVRIILEEGE